MQKFKITQEVSVGTEIEAMLIANRMQYPESHLPVRAKFGVQSVEPEISVTDSLVRKIIAGVLIFQVSKALRNWAKR